MTTVRRPLDISGETPRRRANRANRMFEVLAELYPDARCELDFRSPFELLIATVLSAQSTDKTINTVTPALFERYPGPEDFANADQADMEEMIRPTGFFRNKATAVIGIGRALVDNFDGVVPEGIDELVTLPGVGRKTANVVRGHAFGLPAITTDTHVLRLARRLGWTAATKPEVVEAEVGALFKPELWTQVSDVVIFHGRRRCHARKPACGVCPVAADCPSFGEGPTDPTEAARLVKG